MSLNRGQVNSLGVLEMRKLSFIPKHFSRISIRVECDTKLLEQWINYHLNSRYAIIQSLSIDNHNKMIPTLEVGLEDPTEITMLTLGCPYLHK